MIPSATIPRTIAEISPAWLTEVLRAGGWINRAVIVDIKVKPIGQSFGFLDCLARLRLTYDHSENGAPRAVVVKIPSADPGYRGIGDRYHAYEREIRFYAEIAPKSPIRLPRCYHSAIDRASGAYLLVLEDLSSLEAGDQVKGVTIPQAHAAVETIGRFHAAWWQNSELDRHDWMPFRHIQLARYRERWPRFRDTIGPHLPAVAVAVGEWLNVHLEELLQALAERPHTIVHSDFRADNVLFAPLDDPNPVVILDWQLAIRSGGVLDLARFLCGSLDSADRTAAEPDLVRRWHAALEAGGVRGYSVADAFQDFHRAVVLSLYYPVTIHEAEEAAGKRGIELADAQIRRYFTAASERDWESLLPR